MIFGIAETCRCISVRTSVCIIVAESESEAGAKQLHGL